MKKAELKAQLAKKILATDDKNVLNYIQSVFNSVDRWEDQLPADIRKSLDKSIAQADAGQYESHEKVMKKYKKWLKK